MDLDEQVLIAVRKINPKLVGRYSVNTGDFDADDQLFVKACEHANIVADKVADQDWTEGIAIVDIVDATVNAMCK